MRLLVLSLLLSNTLISGASAQSQEDGPITKKVSELLSSINITYKWYDPKDEDRYDNSNAAAYPEPKIDYISPGNLILKRKDPVTNKEQLYKAVLKDISKIKISADMQIKSSTCNVHPKTRCKISIEYPSVRFNFTPADHKEKVAFIGMNIFEIPIASLIEMDSDIFKGSVYELSCNDWTWGEYEKQKKIEIIEAGVTIEETSADLRMDVKKLRGIPIPSTCSTKEGRCSLFHPQQTTRDLYMSTVKDFPLYLEVSHKKNESCTIEFQSTVGFVQDEKGYLRVKQKLSSEQILKIQERIVNQKFLARWKENLLKAKLMRKPLFDRASISDLAPIVQQDWFTLFNLQQNGGASYSNNNDNEYKIILNLRDNFKNLDMDIP